MIKYYWPVKSLTPTKSIFLQLVRLNPLVSIFIDFNYIKSSNYSENNNLSNKIDNKIPWLDELLYINIYQTENETCSDHCNMRNVVGEKIPSTNSNHTKNKSYNDTYNAMGKEISFMEEI